MFGLNAIDMLPLGLFSLWVEPADNFLFARQAKKKKEIILLPDGMFEHARCSSAIELYAIPLIW